MSGFVDGVTSLFNNLINRRSGLNQNVITSHKVCDGDLREIYKTGLGRRIVDIKTDYSLNNTLEFASSKDKAIYNDQLQKCVKEAVRFSLAFGRGVILLYEKGANLSQPLPPNKKYMMRTFSGDMVTALSPVLDLTNPRYNKPQTYNIRGQSIHHSRIVDFVYKLPAELDLPEYQYGGISEFEMIRPQMVNDGIVERAVSRIIDISSTLFYKVENFKQDCQMGNEENVQRYFSALSDFRGLYGDGLVDKEDVIEVHQQSLSNLSEADQITLRRLAMVTGIPLPMLVGENVKGLNSTGDNERQCFQDTISNLQHGYLIDPIRELFAKLDLGKVKFLDNQAESEMARAEYEGKVLVNAERLALMGEDFNDYLVHKGIISPPDFAKLWTEDTQKTIDDLENEA